MKDICNEQIDFADDFGDNPTTFHCNLPKGHKGAHRETGSMYNKIYKVSWIKESIESESNEDRFQE